MAVLPIHLGMFRLQLAEEETRIMLFGRYKGTKEDFDFLGFTFFNTKMRNGKCKHSVCTSKKKLKAKRQTVKTWVRQRMNKLVTETMAQVTAILRGQ